MIRILVALVLCLGPSPPQTAQSGSLGDITPSGEAALIELFAQRITGLNIPLFAAPALPPPVCRPGHSGVTRGLFIGANQWSDDPALWFRGTVNDGEIVTSVLAGRGADPANLIVLGDDSTHAGLADAAQTMLRQTGCGDSVVIGVSAIAFGPKVMALSSAEGGPFNDEPKAVELRDLAGSALAPGLADPILAGGPWIPLNQVEPGQAPVLSAAALSELVTQFRNRGADVSVIPDTASAKSFALEQRQAVLDSRLTWVDTGAQRDTSFLPTALVDSAGALSVCYGTRPGQVAIERRFPKGQRDAKVYGGFSYAFARALAVSARATIGAIMRAVQALHGDARFGDISDMAFASTAPDLDLIAESRPERPVQDGEIVIDTPEATRAGLKLTKPTIAVAGRVLSRGAPIEVEVNGIPATLIGASGFTADIPLSVGVNRIKVFALTNENEAIIHSFELHYEGDIRAAIGAGRNFAVLIANQDYTDGSGIADLATPIGDATALGAVLRDRYGFLTEAPLPDGTPLPLTLFNATQRDIGLTLDRLSRVVGARDDVIVFYAGHGEYEQLTGAAYWLPSDAVAGAFSTFPEASAITRALQRMAAGNVLVISDSCYSGMLLRGGDSVALPEGGDRLAALQRLNDARSRVVLSSGGNTPVLDGGGAHSVFAAALLDALRNPAETAFSARELHASVHSTVIQRAAQEPDFRPVQGAGHDGGDFVFLLRE